MKILVTGANGFIGKNLVATLINMDYQIYTFDRDNSLEDLYTMLDDTDLIFHLAGVNRPKHTSEFYSGNSNLTDTICSYLETSKKTIKLVLSSSIQAEIDNDYGKSKRLAEERVQEFNLRTQNPVSIYRFKNVFGKWSRPNYNSVIATWCYSISRDMPIEISNPDTLITFEYIDDVIHSLCSEINCNTSTVATCDYRTITTNYTRSLGVVAAQLRSFRESRKSLFLPQLGDAFEKKLYSTYLSFLPTDQFAYSLHSHQDERGSFTEFTKSVSSGQMSINVSKPGITKGQHWHHTKNEKFLVVSGSACIQFRDIFSDEVIEYFVSGDDLVVVDIPTGYTHNIINIGDTNLVTVMWVNECFDASNPDTFFLEV